VFNCLKCLCLWSHQILILAVLYWPLLYYCTDHCCITVLTTAVWPLLCYCTDDCCVTVLTTAVLLCWPLHWTQVYVGAGGIFGRWQLRRRLWKLLKQSLHSTAQRSLYVPPGLTLTKSTFCPHTVFMCFVWISEQTAIISLYSINWLVCITERVCVYCAVRTGSWNVIQANLRLLSISCAHHNCALQYAQLTFTYVSCYSSAQTRTPIGWRHVPRIPLR